MAPAYGIDLPRLKQVYLDLQRQVHPDRFARAEVATQRIAAQWATQVNQAYRTLIHPTDRASYLLHLHGIEVLEAPGNAISPEFLGEQMAWRERISAARDKGDLTELARLGGQLDAEIRAQQDALAELLDDERDFPKAAEMTRELKFMDKLRETCRTQ